jgi:transposase
MTLSTETRRLIVEWRLAHGKSYDEIALLAHCSTRTVCNVLTYWRNYHTVDNPCVQPKGRPRALNHGDLSYISGLIQARPKIFLDEIQEELAVNREVVVSLATLSRTLHRQALSHKRVSRTAFERNEELRAIWVAEYGDIPKEYFVWMDESSVDDRTNQRHSGWALTGRACVSRETFLRGQRYSILPALTTDGIIALDIFEGSVDKDRFLQFLREQVVSTKLPLV